jgi:3-oxoacyl-[acyl-carrier-protein] synthase II
LFYISAASTISHQPTFRNVGFSDHIGELGQTSPLLTPDFKEFIEPGLLRRMSKILRMSVTCAKDALDQAQLSQPDSIVVGTGLGCLQDTEKFLNNFLTIEGLLPPTAFIQSTHNTLAGQISLSLGNHGYNMTHTQNSLSFEHAMLDAMLLLGENDTHVLVGAGDEYIEILDEICINLALAPGALASGASFFVLSKVQSEVARVRVADVAAVGLVQDLITVIGTFLSTNALTADGIDLLLISGNPVFDGPSSFKATFPDRTEILNYPRFSGWYATNSAFALHLAVDKMQLNKNIKNVLIVNNLVGSNLGLTLLQSLET